MASGKSPLGRLCPTWSQWNRTYWTMRNLHVWVWFEWGKRDAQLVGKFQDLATLIKLQWCQIYRYLDELNFSLKGIDWKVRWHFIDHDLYVLGLWTSLQFKLLDFAKRLRLISQLKHLGPSYCKSLSLHHLEPHPGSLLWLCLTLSTRGHVIQSEFSFFGHPHS